MQIFLGTLTQKAETLREKISRLYKVNKNNIIFGNGSDELFT